MTLQWLDWEIELQLIVSVDSTGVMVESEEIVCQHARDEALFYSYMEVSMRLEGSTSRSPAKYRVKW